MWFQAISPYWTGLQIYSVAQESFSKIASTWLVGRRIFTVMYVLNPHFNHRHIQVRRLRNPFELNCGWYKDIRCIQAWSFPAFALGDWVENLYCVPKALDQLWSLTNIPRGPSGPYQSEGATVLFIGCCLQMTLNATAKQPLLISALYYYLIHSLGQMPLSAPW